MVSSTTANFNNFCIHYICRNPDLFKDIDREFFEDNKYVMSIYILIKSWYKHFKLLPFDLGNPTYDQLWEYAERELLNLPLDKEVSPEIRLDSLKQNIKYIVEFNYNKFDPEWVKKTVEAWVLSKNWEAGLKRSIEYYRTQKVNPDTVRDVINKCKEIISAKASISFEEDDSVSFLDAKAHQQINPTAMFKCGWSEVNKWLNGGFEPGTLSIFLGESNIGKSIFLVQLAFDLARNGNNVLFVSLEMATQKVLKRMGANAFGIKASEYTNVSQDIEKMNTLISNFIRDQDSSFVPFGELIIKRFGKASMATIDAFIKKKEESLGKKFHAVVIDYLGEMSNDQGVSTEKMYTYHKQNANEMFSSGVDNNRAMITAHQIKIGAYGVSDYTLKDIGESSGVIHRSDNIFGIIQDPNMKKDSYYMLKNLKTRDSEYKDYVTRMQIDYSLMRLTNNDTTKPFGQAT